MGLLLESWSCQITAQYNCRAWGLTSWFLTSSQSASQPPPDMIKIVVLFTLLGLAVSAPRPDDAAPAVLPYVLPYHAGVYPYAGVPLVYAAPALDSGLVYPLA